MEVEVEVELEVEAVAVVEVAVSAGILLRLGSLVADTENTEASIMNVLQR